ncbi:hypothetical protein KIW84_031521 [Lathyrus oleraceus]|uniref:Pectinesterase n=1 Tax=Pisum sativum TaxID=3888 RepID=A0A9D4XW10_PEA|nr:hypothetical protein KIW84_031521 [Pisum sativum]
MSKFVLFFFFVLTILTTKLPITTTCEWSSSLINEYNVTHVFTVDKMNCGNYSTIQEAINNVPDFSVEHTLVIVGSGIYSYTFGVFATEFIAYNISFKNTFPPPSQGVKGAQAVALRVNGDKAAFYGCGFYGAQDTLHDDLGRHYYKGCFIQGSIDFIFGNARSLYEDCILSSIAKPEWVGDGGCITAQGQELLADNSGFSFLNCYINVTGKLLLGRPWRKYAKVIFSTTFMSDVVSPIGWNDKLKDDSVNQTIFFGEYNCKGPGAIRTSPPRAPFGKQLKDDEAAPYISISYIDGNEWLHQV